jgi:hypothetical protein
MKTNKKYWEILGRNERVLPEGYEERQHFMETLFIIRRLAKKHQRFAEMECNGVGFVRGTTYYAGKIDEYARREYGYSVRSAYTVPGSEETIFTIESNKIETRITALATGIGLVALFQGDPRGFTVRIVTAADLWVDLCF